jgi:hypothetical protein
MPVWLLFCSTTVAGTVTGGRPFFSRVTLALAPVPVQLTLYSPAGNTVDPTCTAPLNLIVCELLAARAETERRVQTITNPIKRFMLIS